MMMQRTFLRASEKEVRKLWGAEYWLCNNERYAAKILVLEPGFQCSLHYHVIKKETFIVLWGLVKLEVYTPKDTLYLSPGDKYTLEPGRAHRFTAIDGDAQILEISSTHSDDDVVRIEDSRAI